MWMLSGAPRRFLNFILEVEIWAHLGVFEGIGDQKLIVQGLYLGSKNKIEKSPRCPLKHSHEGSLAKKGANLAQGFGL